jgi:hypothetical protein
MPSARRQKPKGKAAVRRESRARAPVRSPPARPAPRKAPAAKASGGGKSAPIAPAAAKGNATAPAVLPVVRRADGRVHVLSLSFVRDGDEFLARMETDAGQITELKNRALDQLLTLVASELEDLLE